MGIGSSILGFFTGNAGSKIIEIADGAHLGAEERMNIDQKDLESARSMQMPTGTTGFDVMVNCLSRLVRPIITFWLIGGLMGFYTFQPIASVPKFYQSLIILVLTFWFGGRAIMKDIPVFLKHLKK